MHRVTKLIRRAAFWIIVGVAALAAAQWARAQFVHEWFRYLAPRPEPSIGGTHPTAARARVIELNGVGIAYRTFECRLRPNEPFGLDRLHAAPRDVTWSECKPTARHLGFAYGPDSNGNDGVAIPYWMFVAAGGIAWSARAYLHRRRRRDAGQKICVACGYDLRATPERCPECGNVVASPTSPASQPPPMPASPG